MDISRRHTVNIAGRLLEGGLDMGMLDQLTCEVPQVFSSSLNQPQAPDLPGTHHTLKTRHHMPCRDLYY